MSGSWSGSLSDWMNSDKVSALAVGCPTRAVGGWMHGLAPAGDQR